MTFLKSKNTLLVLLMAFMMLMAAVLLPMATGQQSPWPQQSGQGSQMAGGTLAIPGLENVQGLAQGDNAIVMSISDISREQDKTYFKVDSFALLNKGSQEATVYKLSGGLPGVADRSSNEVQVDLSSLSTSMHPPSKANMNDLGKSMITSTSALAIMAQFSTKDIGTAKSTFEVQKMGMIPPDGKMSTFDMKQPTTAVFDSQSMRLYAVGFPELFDALGKVKSAMDNNQYTSVAPGISEGPTVVVMPPMIMPAIVPIPIPMGPWPPGPPGPVPPGPGPHCGHCPPGTVCDSATDRCVPYHQCTPPCPPGQVCNAATGTCGASHACPPCNPGETCNQATGTCVKLHQCDPPCPNGMVCGGSSGTCVSQRGCEHACGPGQTCNYISGECVPQQTQHCVDCGFSGQVCDTTSGQCKPRSQVPCGGACGAGSICRADGTCGQPLTCPGGCPGGACDGSTGRCREQCNPPCSGNSRCVDGSCTVAYMATGKPSASPSASLKPSVTTKPSVSAKPGSVTPGVSMPPSSTPSVTMTKPPSLTPSAVKKPSVTPFVSPHSLVSVKPSPRISTVPVNKPSITAKPPTLKPSPIQGVVSRPSVTTKPPASKPSYTPAIMRKPSVTAKPLTAVHDTRRTPVQAQQRTSSKPVKPSPSPTVKAR